MKQSILTALLAVHSTSAQDISEDALSGLNLRCVPPSDPEWFDNGNKAETVETITDVQSCFAHAVGIVTDNSNYPEETYIECWEAVVTEGGAFQCNASYTEIPTGTTTDDIRVRQEEGAEEGVTYYAWQWEFDTTLLEFPEEEPESVDEDTEEDAGHKFAASAFAAAAAMMISNL